MLMVVLVVLILSLARVVNYMVVDMGRQALQEVMDLLDTMEMREILYLVLMEI